MGDDTKAKKSWGNKDGNKTGFKKQFKAKFNKKSDQAKNSFQGFTTSAEGKKFKKPRWTKDDSRKKSNAAKLASWAMLKINYSWRFIFLLFFAD